MGLVGDRRDRVRLVGSTELFERRSSGRGVCAPVRQGAGGGAPARCHGESGGGAGDRVRREDHVEASGLHLRLVADAPASYRWAKLRSAYLLRSRPSRFPRSPRTHRRFTYTASRYASAHGVEEFIQLRVERMPRPHGQLRCGHPQLLLLTRAASQCHARSSLIETCPRPFNDD